MACTKLHYCTSSQSKSNLTLSFQKRHRHKILMVTIIVVIKTEILSEQKIGEVFYDMLIYYALHCFNNPFCFYYKTTEYE